MLFAGLDSIRDCIAFPKTQRATDLMTGAPGRVDPKQLRELGTQAGRLTKRPGSGRLTRLRHAERDGTIISSSGA